MLAWLLLLGPWALAQDGLSRDAIVRAARAGDLATLLAGPFEDADLPLVARELGRLGDPRASERLALLAGLSDPEVREAALGGLATTPGSAPALRALVPVVEAPGQRATLWWALGRQGDTRDVGPLADALGRPWPEGAAAAVGLGLLARRGVALDGLTERLVGRLTAPDPRTLQAVAWTLAQARPVLDARQLAQVRRAQGRAPHAATVAWLEEVLTGTAAPPALRTVQADLPAPAACAAPEVLPSVATVRTSLGPVRVLLEPSWAPCGVEAWTATGPGGVDVGTPSPAAPIVADTDAPERVPAYAEVDARPMEEGCLALDPADPGRWSLLVAPAPELAGSWVRLGRVIEGLDLVRRLDGDARILAVEPEHGGATP